MNKLFTKIAKIFLGLSMAAGVGVAVGTNSVKAKEARAASYTITFSQGGSSTDGTSASTSTACSTIVSDGSSYLSGNLATATKVWYSSKNYLHLGSGSAAGVLKMNLSSAGQVTPTSIVVNAKRYSTSTACTLKVNGSATQSLTSDYADYTFNITSAITYIQLDTSKGAGVKSITVNYSSGTKLGTPENLSVSGTTMTWTNVSNNSGYSYVIDTNPASSETTGNLSTNVTTFDASTLSLSAGNYTFKVKAKGTGSYVDSDYTSTVNFTISGSGGGGNDYSVGFESSESFTASTTYNNTSANPFGPSGSQWKTVFGTVSTNDAIAGSQSMQMRYYSDKSTLGYTYTDFKTDNVKTISFKYKASNTAIKMDVWYSTTSSDTPSWTKLGNTVNTATSSNTFSHTFTPVVSNFKLKIGISSSSTQPSSGNYKFIVDDVSFTTQSSTEKVVEVSKTFGSKVMLGKSNASRVVSGLSAASQNITSPVYKWEIVSPSAANIAEISGTGATPTFTIHAAGTLEIKASARASADADIDSNYTACTSNISLQIVNYGGSFSWTDRSKMIFKEGQGFDVSPTTISLTLNDDTVVDYGGDYSGLELYMGTTAQNVALVTQQTIASITSETDVNNKYYKLVDPTYEIGSGANQVATVVFTAKATITLGSVANVTQIAKNQTIYLTASISEGWGNTVTYTSSSAAVTVNSSGVVKSGSSTASDVVITATLANGNSATYTIDVLESKVYTIEEAYDMVSGFNTAEEDMYYGSDTAGSETELYTVRGFYYLYNDGSDDWTCLCDDPSNPQKVLKLYECSGSDIEFEQGEILTASGYLNDYKHGGNYYLCDGELISHEQQAGDRVVDSSNTYVTPAQDSTTYSFGASFSHPGTIHIAYTDGFSRETDLASATVTGNNMFVLGSQTVSVYVNDVVFSGNDNLLVGTYTIDVTNVGAVYTIPGFSETGSGFSSSTVGSSTSPWRGSGIGSDYTSHSPYLLRLDGDGDYFEYVFQEGDTNNASSYTCTVTLKKVGGNGESSFTLQGIDANGDPITGVTGSTSVAEGAQNAICEVSGVLSNANNVELTALRFVFVKASNIGVSGASITAPEQTNTDLINAQDDALAAYLSQFKTCESGWASRNDVVKLVTEYNAMHSTAKTAFNSQTVTDYDWTNAEEYNISTHEYTGGSKSLAGVSAIEKLKTMVDAYNRSLEQGESTLVLQTPSGNFSTLGSSSIMLLFAKNNNTAMIIVIISLVSVSAIGGYFFLRRRKEQ